MFGGLNRLLAAALVAGAASAAMLAGPPAALACNSGTSAVNVYKECRQTGGGSKPSTGGPSKRTTTTPHHISGRTTKALSHAGKRDKNALENLVSENGLRRHLSASSAAPTTEPSALGSAFDLGSGPTALLIALAATAALLLGGSSVRVWRNRHRA
jgi:hypothetical protein